MRAMVAGPQSPSRQELDEMQLIPQLLATAGWTSFSGVFSTVFPLVVVLAVLAWYWVAARRHP
jgi:hypothetical protein